MIFNIGMDDTDSKEGMCTTYVGAVILEDIEELGARSIERPHLIRLNPNWKYKTRGNCSVSLRVEAEEDMIPEIKKIVLDRVEELAELHIEETTPGVAFYEGEKIPEDLVDYSMRVVREVLTREEAKGMAEKVGAELHGFREGRGIIGALASIGHPLEDDSTYELIAYRTEENRGTPRRIVEESVERMNEETYPETFDNLDLETGEIRITPHTPGPILYGIRSETPEAAFRAREMVEAEEPIERELLFKTNQATDEHLVECEIEGVKPYRSVIVRGEVIEEPYTITGGHVFFSIRDSTGEIRCAAFEPTRRFRNVVRKLVRGDEVRVFGGVKEKSAVPLTVNLEKIEILGLEASKEIKNPPCLECGNRMESAGKDKGFECGKCGRRLPQSAQVELEVDRGLEEKTYEVPPRARRHLAKPLVRERKNKK